jgi:hypothetical protein
MKRMSIQDKQRCVELEMLTSKLENELSTYKMNCDELKMQNEELISKNEDLLNH